MTYINKVILRFFVITVVLLFPTKALAGCDDEKWDYLLGTTIGEIENDKIYSRFAKGQCTWYAWGRFKEVHSKKIIFRAKNGLDAKVWPELIANCRVNANVSEQSIAVSRMGRYGHLIFVEHIQGRSVYYTDANGDANGIYDRGIDCVLKKADVDSAFWQQFTSFIHP